MSVSSRPGIGSDNFVTLHLSEKQRRSKSSIAHRGWENLQTPSFVRLETEVYS